MKRLLAIILATLLLLSLTACGALPGRPEEAPPAPAEEVEKEQPAEAEKPAKVEEEELPEEAELPEEEEIIEEENVPETVSNFEAFTPIETDECVLTIKDVDPDFDWGYAIKVSLENKSADKTLMFSAEEAAVDGLELRPGFYETVAPGKKANSEITFSNYDIKEAGKLDFTDIELHILVREAENWEADSLADEVFHVYPYGEDKVVKYVREKGADDQVLVDNDDVAVTVVGQGTDEIRGYMVYLFLENKTDAHLMFSADDASINGYMADPFFAYSVMPGKGTFAAMSWSNDVLAGNDITDIEEIEFKLRAHERYNFSAGDVFSEVVTVKP